MSHIPPMPPGFTDQTAWDAIHHRFSVEGSLIDAAVTAWQQDNQPRVRAAMDAERDHSRRVYCIVAAHAQQFETVCRILNVDPRRQRRVRNSSDLQGVGISSIVLADPVYELLGSEAEQTRYWDIMEIVRMIERRDGAQPRVIST